MQKSNNYRSNAMPKGTCNAGNSKISFHSGMQVERWNSEDAMLTGPQYKGCDIGVDNLAEIQNNGIPKKFLCTQHMSFIRWSTCG
jgi:nitrous oxidase accessory protein NosD